MAVLKYRDPVTGEIRTVDGFAVPTGGGGTADHSLLINRDVPDQHPISAITGLASALNGTKDHAVMTNRGAPGQHPISAITGLAEALQSTAGTYQELVVWSGDGWTCRSQPITERPSNEALQYSSGGRVIWDTSMDPSFTTPPSLARAGDMWIPHGSVTPGAGVVVPQYSPVEAGAVLPLSYSISSLPGTVRYMSPSGNDTNSGLTTGAPKRTLQAALDASVPGDSIVLLQGTYPISENRATISKRITITAAPGADVVFDGSIALSTFPVGEGALIRYPYTSMESRSYFEGIGFTAESDTPYPGAIVGSTPTALAQERGWVIGNPTNGTYTVPTDQSQDLGFTTDTRVPCVAVGMYPDQVWIDRQPLKQVQVKEKVKKGYFFVNRGNSDASALVQLYLHQDDISAINGESSRIRVSGAGGTTNFLFVNGDDVTLRGFKIFGYSPRHTHFALQTETGISNLRVEDVVFDSCAGVSIKVFGNHTGTDFSGAKIVRNVRFERVSVINAQWMGASVDFADDVVFSHCLFDGVNVDGTIRHSPKSGAIKATKCHRMVVEHSVFRNVISAHALWWDQSNYDCVLASTYFEDIAQSAIFYEISHGLLMVNNLVNRNGAASETVRLSGSSGIRLINNTIIGSDAPVSNIIELRSKYYLAGRPLAEHTDRYDGKSAYPPTGINGTGSDLDRARPGAYAPAGKTNLTPGMNWQAEFLQLLNNVIVNTGSTGQPLYVRTYASAEPATVKPAKDLLPKSGDLIDGNVYCTGAPSGLLAVVKTVSASDPGAASASSLTSWKNALKAVHYGLVDPEKSSLSGTVSQWVNPVTGEPTQELVAAHGSAALLPSDPKVSQWVSSTSRNYGAMIAPPGGW